MEIEYIRWDEDALIELIAQRISNSLFKESSKGGIDDPLGIWSRVFTESIPARRQPIAPHAYVIERTLFRPRDVILFASLAVEEARRARHESILSNDIKRAERDYSRMKLRDLVSEQSFQYPGLREVVEEFRRSNAGYATNDLLFKVLEIREKIGSSHEWLHESEEEVLKTLYKMGFICFTRKGGKLRGTQIVHSAVEEDPTVILEQERLFISPIFRQGLDTKS